MASLFHLSSLSEGMKTVLITKIMHIDRECQSHFWKWSISDLREKSSDEHQLAKISAGSRVGL
jgi:hypothetical protein